MASEVKDASASSGGAPSHATDETSAQSRDDVARFDLAHPAVARK